MKSSNFIDSESKYELTTPPISGHKRQKTKGKGEEGQVGSTEASREKHPNSDLPSGTVRDLNANLMAVTAHPRSSFPAVHFPISSLSLFIPPSFSFPSTLFVSQTSFHNSVMNEERKSTLNCLVCLVDDRTKQLRSCTCVHSHNSNVFRNPPLPIL